MEYINLGNAVNDGTGDTLRQAGLKINNNFENINTEFVKKEDLGEPGSPPILDSGGNIVGIVSHRDIQIGSSSEFIPYSGEIIVNKIGNRPISISVGDDETNNGNLIGLQPILILEKIDNDGINFVSIPCSASLSGDYSVMFSASLYFDNQSSDEGELEANGFCICNIYDGTNYTTAVLMSGFLVTIPASTVTIINIPLQVSIFSLDTDNDIHFLKFRKKTNSDAGNLLSLSSILSSMTFQPIAKIET